MEASRPSGVLSVQATSIRANCTGGVDVGSCTDCCEAFVDLHDAFAKGACAV